MARQNKQPEAEVEAPQTKVQALMGHLLALRRVLVICAGAIAALFLLVFYFGIDWLMGLIISPIEQRGIQIIYTAMSEAMMVKMKVALIAAVVIASPVIIWQIWSFLKPGLYPSERKIFRILFFVALILFLTGVAFCYSAVYMLALDFFIVMGDGMALPMLSIDKYVGFLFGFVIPFGIAFELPVALYMTTRVGITNYKMLAGKRKFVILAIVVFAAILTPPDVVSQLMLAVPMWLLFEIGIGVSRFVKPRNRDEELE